MERIVRVPSQKTEEGWTDEKKKNERHATNGREGRMRGWNKYRKHVNRSRVNEKGVDKPAIEKCYCLRTARGSRYFMESRLRNTATRHMTNVKRCCSYAQKKNTHTEERSIPLLLLLMMLMRGWLSVTLRSHTVVLWCATVERVWRKPRTSAIRNSSACLIDVTGACSSAAWDTLPPSFLPAQPVVFANNALKGFSTAARTTCYPAKVLFAAVRNSPVLRFACDRAEWSGEAEKDFDVSVMYESDKVVGVLSKAVASFI